MDSMKNNTEVTSRFINQTRWMKGEWILESIERFLSRKFLIFGATDVLLK